VGEHGNFLGIRIRECHLEEDPARWDPVTGLIDYNRSGYPLLEIVTEPDFKTSAEVRDWLKKLITTLSYIQAVNKDMGVKCDVNVSIAPSFYRVEVKNVNSFRSIIKTIEYELERQQRESVKEQHTRAWSDAEQVTKFMRSKEQALDYMFIPDPDLPVVEISRKMLAQVQKELPEKPEQKLQKLLKAGVEKTTAEVIATDLPLSEFFERAAKKVKPTTVANWIRKEFLRLDKDLDSFNEDHLIELLSLLQANTITENVSRQIVQQLVEKDFSPKKYVEQHSLTSISGSNELEKLCNEAMKNNPKAVEDVKSGNMQALNFLVGQVMRVTKGKAKPQELKEIFEKLI
jgi:aspartyl-tRNA(Asn)/glutamyl-tRNA(Gln) amidotransferase subunit B